LHGSINDKSPGKTLFTIPSAYDGYVKLPNNLSATLFSNKLNLNRYCYITAINRVNAKGESPCFQHFKPLSMPKIENIDAEYVTDKNGVKKSVILPLDDFYELLEELEDMAAVAERKDEPTISHEQLVEDLKKNGLL